MFSEAALKKLGYSSVIASIRRKQAGGSSGKSGYRYEDYFIIFKLTEAATPAAARKCKKFSIQEGAFCLVDDIVTKNGQLDFYQLKTSPKTHWSKSLRADFESQIRVCQRNKKRHRLHLVIPQKTLAKRLAARIPTSIQQASDIVCFPRVKNRRELWLSTSLLYPALVELCADPNPTPEALEALTTAFEVAWRDCSSPGRFTPLARVLGYIRKREDIPLRSDWNDTSKEWHAAKTVMHQIKGLSFDTSRGFFCYFHNGESGRFKCGTASYKRFLKRINKS